MRIKVYRSGSVKMAKYLCCIHHPLYMLYGPIHSNARYKMLLPAGPDCPICPLCLVSWCDPSNFHFSPWSTQHPTHCWLQYFSTHIFHSHYSSYRAPVASCLTLSLNIFIYLSERQDWVIRYQAAGRSYLVMTQERRGEERGDQQANQFVGMLMTGPG